MKSCLQVLIATVFLVSIPPSVLWAQPTRNQAPPTPNSTTISGAVSSQDPAMEERFKLLEGKIGELEKQNAELSAIHEKAEDSRVDNMAKEIETNYPSAYEKSALNLTIIMTDVIIAATLAGLVYAFVTLARTRTTYRNDSRAVAADMVTANNHFLTGRFSNNIALVLSEIAWDPGNEYALTVPHLATVAVTYQKASYDAFREKTRPEFEKDMPIWTLKSLNNLIFMLSNFPSNPESAHIHDYLKELRARSEFKKHPLLVNTYAFALLIFRDQLVATWEIPIEKIYLEVLGLLNGQLANKDDLTLSSSSELNRIIRLYNSLQSSSQEIDST
jgi:hypothetical protein